MKIKQNELNKYLKKIRDSKAKITPQRIEILKVLLRNKDEHYTTDDIIKKLKNKKIGQATVYRTMELFCHAGILKRVNFKDEDFARYDLVDLTVPHFHHHLVCNNCGKVVEITEDLLETLEERIESVYTFKVTDHELVIKGVCAACQTGENHEQA